MFPVVLEEQPPLSADSGADVFSRLERRRTTRYLIELPVRYHTLSAKLQASGFGRTVNMSSGGLMISRQLALAPDPSFFGVPAGVKLELRIAWPSELDGKVPLQVVATGRVVRSLENGFAVELLSHEFHTLKRNY